MAAEQKEFKDFKNEMEKSLLLEESNK